MATMFPSELGGFSATEGERRTFEFFRSRARPDSRFLVWYAPDIRDREPDFILYTPDCGLIVWEVKDWVIEQILELDPKTALLRIGSATERRKQPLAQAREYVHALMGLLGKAFGGKKLPCPIDCGAILPHIAREEFVGAGLDRVLNPDKVLFWDEITAPGGIGATFGPDAFQEWLAKRFPPLFPFAHSESGLARIRGAIFPVARLSLPARGGAAPAENDQMTVLDKDQENLARLLGAGKTLLSGPSGSGKTIILAHQAWWLPAMDKNVKRVLVTCFNLALVGYIRRLLSKKGARLGPDGIEVIPFYSLCERILGERLAHSSEDGDYYALAVEETIERLKGEHPLKNHWDAILVDEGQDFSPAMVKVILGLLPEHGALTVAIDENQSLYVGRPGWLGDLAPSMKTRKLTRQYRNTRQIAALAARVLESAGCESAGAEGEEPQFVEARMPEQIEKAAERIAELVASGVAMSEIAVLYVKKRSPEVAHIPNAVISALESRGVLARWSARDAESKRNYDITTDSVTVSTIHSAKGLDFGHVFLLGMDGLDPVSGRGLAYVGLTRARETLTIFYSDKNWKTSFFGEA